MVISTNLLESYKSSLNFLLIKIKNSNSTSNINNIAYYADNYLLKNDNLTLLNTLINEKNSTILSYNDEIINFNLTFYNNLAKIAENKSLIEIKSTVINDGLNTTFSNVYNKYKLSGFDSNTIDKIYLQNIAMRNKSVYIPSRRFKLNMTARVVIKDQFTQYIDPH